MTGIYPSPLGVILLTGDEIGLTDVRFGEPGFGAERQIPPDLLPAARWLDRYFAGEQPGELPPLHPVGTPFQLQVWEMLREIPYAFTAPCPPRPSGVPWGKTSCPCSSPATGLSAPTAVSPATPGASGGRNGF